MQTRRSHLVWSVLVWSVLVGIAVGAGSLFGQGTVQSLDGPWRVQEGASAAWSQAEWDDRSWPLVVLPVAVEGLPKANVATDEVKSWWCRRRVRLIGGTTPGGRLGFMIGTPPAGRYEAFVDGASIGTYDAASMAPPARRVPRVFHLPENVGRGAEMQIAIRFEAANWLSSAGQQQLGPAGRDWAIGSYAALLERAELIRMRELRGSLGWLALCVITILLGLGHLLVGLVRPAERGALWLGVLALLTALAAAVSVGGIEVGIPLDTIGPLQAAGQLLAVVLAIQWLWARFGPEVALWLRIYQLSLVVLAGLVLVPGWAVVPVFHTLRWLWLLPGILAMTVRLAEVAWRGRAWSRAVAGAALVWLAAGLAELLQQVLQGTSTAVVPFLAFASWIAVTTVALVSQLGRARAEHATLSNQLEQMIVDRTEELSADNSRLSSDLAERRLAEGAMRMIERAIEQAHEAIAILDATGAIQYVNHAWAHSHRYEVIDVIGHHFGMFFEPAELHQKVGPLMELAAKSGVVEGQLHHRRFDGKHFTTAASITSLRDDMSHPAGFVTIARDVSEREEAARENAQLERQEVRAQRLESLATLAGGIAHDYNNLLTAVLSNAALALREAKEESSVHDKLTQIESAAERARLLSHRLLVVAGMSEPAPQRLQLNEVVSAMREPLAPLVGDRATLDFQLKPDLPLVELDPDQIQQMIFDLAANAVESLGTEKGFITLRTSTLKAPSEYFRDAFVVADHQTGEYVFLEVSDSGMGMDDETRDRMFEPLFTTKSSARGLGLAAVQGIVRGHHGSIKVFSEAGRGTTMQVLLPQFEAPVAASSRGSATEDLEDWRNEGTVLVVDDQIYVLDVCEAILMNHGLEVLTAGDGPSGLALYRRHQDRIRLVLLDWTMPEMNGEQVFREIRQMAPKARVILMSGYEERQVMNDLAGLGLAGFLQKPFKPRDVITKVREVLSAR